jgi:hypothetical protein
MMTGGVSCRWCLDGRRYYLIDESLEHDAIGIGHHVSLSSPPATSEDDSTTRMGCLATNRHERLLLFEALQAGASGFLLKDAGPAELLHAIRVIAAGDALLAARITRRLIAQFTVERASSQAARRTGWRCRPHARAKCLPSSGRG